MAKVTILSACYGDFDEIRPQAEQDGIDADWVLFTDDRKLKAPGPWRVVYERPRFKHPCLAAKRHKMIPPRSPSIWVDANTEITSPSFAREALAAVNNGIALFQHPRRSCVYTEAEASLGAESQGGKYADQPIVEQVRSYRDAEHPENGGLFACGTIAWDNPDPRLGQQWLAECVRFSFQDQISFPVVARRLGIEPGTFGFSQIEGRENGYLFNRWQKIHAHL